MFIDSHCHLQLFDFDPLGSEVESILSEAEKHKVNKILCVGTNITQYRTLQKLCVKYSNVKISIGLHPTENIEQEPEVQDFLNILEDKNVVAVGETGLDYYRLTGDPKVQQNRFRTQILSAIAVKKPLIIHTRDANEDTMQIIKEENASKARGVFHCFTGNKTFAKEVLDLGFYISFSGIVTFEKAQKLKEVAKWVPLNRILIETDAPYLAPVPFRGKLNKPAYVKYIAEYIADLRKINVEELAVAIEQNCNDLFGLWS